MWKPGSGDTARPGRAKRPRRIAFFLGVAFCLSAAVGGVRAAGSPQWGGGPEHLAVTNGEPVLDAGNVAQLRQEWATSFIGVNPGFGPVSVADGKVFGTIADFGDPNPPPIPGFFKAFAADATTGAILWSRGIGADQGPAEAVPAVDNGRVFVSSQGTPATLYALDEATGALDWSDTPAPGGSQSWISAPAVGDDGTVYVVSGQTLYALNPATGSVAWSAALAGQDVGGAAISPPALTDAGVYVSWNTGQAFGAHAHVTAFDAQTHTELWDRVDLGSGGIAAVGGTVYVSSGGLGLYALDGATGGTIWHQVTASDPSPPAVDLDDSLVVVETAVGTVEARDITDGSLVWNNTSLGLLSGLLSPIVIANGVVYVSGDDRIGSGQAAGLDISNGTALWTQQISATHGVYAPAVGDGFVYLGGDHLFGYTLPHANADLALSTTKAPSFGGDLVYTVSVHNGGPDMAYDVSLTNTIPAGTSLVAASSSQGTGCNQAAPVVCDLSQIRSAADAQVTVRVHLSGTQSYTNHAVVSSASDGNAANNVSDSTATDSPPVVGPSALAWASNVDGDAEIYAWNPSGIGPVNVTATAADEFEPQWSPDGTRIAFDKVVDGNDDVYVMNADGQASYG